MANETGYEFIKLDIANYIATLTLNRPEKLNAISSAMRKEIVAAMEEVGRNDDVRVLVVTGAGRGFCSGADVGAMGGSRGPQSRRSLLTVYGAWGLSLARLEKPTIAAVNGVAAGAGLSIALLCDIRIAGENARFTAAWVKRALVPDIGATYLLPRLIGLEKAYELMYTGDIIDAARAKEIGLVSRVVPQDQLMKTTNELATRIASGPPVTLELIKRGVAKNLIGDLSIQLLYETYAQEVCHKTEDHKEGIASFLERREARFKGM